MVAYIVHRSAHEQLLYVLCLLAHFEREHGDFVRHVNVVPHTEIPSVLANDHITKGDPLDIRAIAEQGHTRTTL